MMRSRDDLILVSSHVPTQYLTKHRIHFFEEVFNKKYEKYRIYEAGLSQSQFSISVQGIIKIIIGVNLFVEFQAIRKS